MPVENEGGESQETSIPSEVTDKFNEIFGSGSEAEVEQEAPENTEAQPASAERNDKGQFAARHRRQAAQEQNDELLEAGVIDADGNPVEETQETEPSDTDEKEPTEGQEGEVEGAAKPNPIDSLDPNHVFAAQQLGWTAEKIERLAKADPELAAETLASLSENYLQLSRQMLTPASLGLPGTPTQQQPAQPKSPTNRLDQFYTKLQQFTEANGEDLGEFVSALKEEVISPLKGLMAEAEASRESARKTEAQSTMKSLSDKFGDFYGATDKPLNLIQQQARQTLGMVADQLRAGARAQGRELSISEAINRAHLIVASQHQRQAVRSEIKQSLQKRQRQLSAKPTQRRNPASVGPSRDKAVGEVAKFWADKGIDVDLD